MNLWVGPAPTARAGHAAVSFGEAIIIVGGGNGESGLGEIHVLETSAAKWAGKVFWYSGLP